MTAHGSESTESTGFLYPFIESEETDAGSLLDDLSASARGKAAESARLQRESLDEYGPALTTAGIEMAERFLRGGRLYTLGNGGSSTDAATLASLFSRPARGRAVAAWSLAADEAVVTALGNDVGFELIFKRQIIAHARDRDVAIALSTSGNSEDSDDGHHRGQTAGTADDRVLRPRRRPNGGGRGSRPLLHGAQPEHSPHPGEPRHSRLPAVVGRAGTHVPSP